MLPQIAGLTRGAKLFYKIMKELIFILYVDFQVYVYRRNAKLRKARFYLLKDVRKRFIISDMEGYFYDDN